MTEIEKRNILLRSSDSDGSFGVHPDIVAFVSDALAAGDNDRVRNLIKSLHPADMAELINLLNAEQREQFTKIIRKDFDPEMLVGLEHGVKEEVLRLLGARKTADAISELDSSEAVQIIEDMEEKGQERILRALSEEKREIVEESLSYAEDIVGRFMNRQFVSIPEEWTVKEVLEYLREEKELPETFYDLFVVDKHHRPMGYIHLSNLLRSRPNMAIREIMNPDVKIISVGMDKDEVSYVFQKYNLSSAPVVNDDGKLVARITIDDVVSIIKKKAEEDIMHLAGVTETDIFLSSRKTAMNRFPWLFVNLLTAIAASAIIALFEDTVAKLVTLAVLFPIIASMSGNAGIQTLTVAVRALSNKELTTMNAVRIATKEIYSGLINGVLFAGIVGAVSLVIYGNFQLSLIFGLAMVVSLCMAALAGVTIPIILEKFGVDPAIASGVILTTITDIASFLSFLGLAKLILA